MINWANNNYIHKHGQKKKNTRTNIHVSVQQICVIECSENAWGNSG